MSRIDDDGKQAFMDFLTLPIPPWEITSKLSFVNTFSHFPPPQPVHWVAHAYVRAREDLERWKPVDIHYEADFAMSEKTQFGFRDSSFPPRLVAGVLYRGSPDSGEVAGLTARQCLPRW